MIRLDHIMIRTPNLGDSIDFYRTIFGMTLDSADPHPEERYNLAFMKDKESGVKIELTYNYGKDSITCYRRGQRFDHVAFYVDDAEKMVHRSIELFGLKASHRVHKSSHDKTYIIGSIISPEGVTIAVVQKLEG